MTQTLSPDTLITNSIASIGGQQVITAIDSIIGIADCTTPDGRSITELHSARGDKLLFKQIHPDRPSFTVIINGSFAWYIDPVTLESQPLDPDSAAMVIGHDFLMLPLITNYELPSKETL